MSTYEVPYSSSPPSTPDRRNKDGARQFSFGASNLSTTPAGAPPSSAGSFTPADPPPSSVLGSSRLDSQYQDQPLPSLRFSKESVLKPPKPKYDHTGSSPSSAPQVRSSRVAQPSNLSHEYKAPVARHNPRGFSADLYYDEEEGEEEEDRMTDDYNQYQSPTQNRYNDRHGSNLDETMEEEDYAEDDRDMDDLGFNSSGPTTRSAANEHNTSSGLDMLRRSREEDLMDFQASTVHSKSASRKDYMFGRIAKDMSNQMGLPPVQESDDLVLGTEDLIIRLYEEGIRATEDEDILKQTLQIIPTELLKLWADYHTATAAHISEEYVSAIGPGPRASPFANANFLASLLLRLRHPGLVNSGSRPESRRLSLQRGLSHEGRVKQIPLLLLEWMDDYHDPYPSQLNEIQAHRPSPASHPLFWDTLLNSLLRGRVVAVVNSLRTAGWRHARHAMEDVRDNGNQVGYTGQTLTNIEKVINDAVQVLQQCPAMRGDWDVRSSDWTLFRLRVDQALENLKQFAEGRYRNSDMGGSFAMSGPQSFTGIAKKAESQVPWNIYQNLLTLYNLLLGDTSAIVENSQDWCEATVGLVVWWNPSGDDGLGPSRAQLSGEGMHAEMYMQQLAESFYRATSDATDFQVNTLSPVEVGLASLFEGNVEAVIGFLRAWSGPVSSAVVEIAALGGWLPRVQSQSLISMDSLDQDDMNVLGLNASSEKGEDIKDYTLIVYASALAMRGEVESTPQFGRPKVVREGWEVAIEVLGRLDSVTKAEEEVGQLLHDFPFDSGATVDKLLRLLNDLGMTSHAENIAEVSLSPPIGKHPTNRTQEYADSLGESSYKYGEALWYYALAHKPKKIKDVLDLLISFSLIYSVSYPPEAEMDNYLLRLISSPKAALTEMSKMDFEAAQLLHRMLSGYATLRKFYDLRDEETKLSTGQKSRIGAIARKSEAASALMAVISSAADNIRGGLYDESRGAVVSVDFLLALLGEALVFVNQPKPVITTSQIDTLLKALEDLQTVPPRVYGACNEFFQTVIASTQGLKGSSPMDLLKKSTSSVSGASSFSLVGSSMLASQLQRSIGNSGVLVKGNVKRGWDWRRGLSSGTTGENILQMLRLGLAKDLAKVWVLEADGQL
jgi:hypothetical protein